MRTNTQPSPAITSLRFVSWFLPLLLALLPIGLLSVYSYRIASESVLNIIRSEDLARTSGIGQLLREDIGTTVSLAQAFGETPGTTRAIENDDTLALTTRLKALTLAFPALESATVRDARGSIIAEYPADTDVRLHDDDALVNQTLSNGRPNVSGVHNETISIGAPLSLSGSVSHVVVLRYRVEHMKKWLESVDLPIESSLFIVDHRGAIVARAGTHADDKHTTYASSEAARKALQGTLHTSEYIDPYGNLMVGTFLPVAAGRNTWIVVSEKPVGVAYRDLQEVRTNIALAGGFLTFVTLGMIVMLARSQSWNMRLNKELKEKNLLLQETAAIVQSSNDAIIGFTRDGKIHTWNSAAEKIFGRSARDTQGQSIAIIIPKEKNNEFAELLSKVKAGETIQNFETIRMRADGTTVPVSVTLSPIRDEKGEVVAVSSIDRDIAQRKKIEQMKDDFISFVSHQLKAPITAIRWNIEALVNGDYGAVPDSMKQPLDEIREVNVQSFQFVNDILNMSRIDRGVIVAERKPLPLRDIVMRAMRDYKQAIEKAGLTASIIEPKEQIVVMADLEKAAEAITNSFSNAIKHTKRGGITVKMYRDGNRGCIDVMDTGEGMPKEIIEKLFLRTGILGVNAAAEKSAGLGLYIAKHFMEIQGGEITVTSVVGKGTTFTYRFPVVQSVS